MAEVCKLLHGVAAGDAREDSDAAPGASTWRSDGDKHVASDRLRSGMILNDIGVSSKISLCGEDKRRACDGWCAGEGGGGVGTGDETVNGAR